MDDLFVAHKYFYFEHIIVEMVWCSFNSSKGERDVRDAQ